MSMNAKTFAVYCYGSIDLIACVNVVLIVLSTIDIIACVKALLIARFAIGLLTTGFSMRASTTPPPSHNFNFRLLSQVSTSNIESQLM
jgi:hypothetical protein